jgi:hypothetical protein
MSKTIYYLGAGASYGKRDNNGAILEGVPVVAEIPKEYEAFKDFISNAEIPTGEIVFQDKYRTDHNDVEEAKRYMLHDIDSLIENIKEHATIDTYARKLHLTRNRGAFNCLKDVLCTFFIWEQIEHKPDNRYDTFLANVLETQTLNLPSDISVISWNYDSQIELAFKAYRRNPGLTIIEKNIVGEWPALPKSGRIFKVNGSATFSDLSSLSSIEQYKDSSVAVQLILYYGNLKADTSSMGFQFRTHLSFAWEGAPNQENLMNSIKVTTEDTEQVVVIGYSFPFFNRDTDREIFRNMPSLKKVYIQDINPHAVKESIQAVLPADHQIEVVPISNCEQFYLPSEL